MDCPGCGNENPPDASFCGECAASLASEVACPGCGRRNPAAQKFCHACAAPLTASTTARTREREPRAYTPTHLAGKILQSKSALEGERKQVTILFADVKGSVDLADQVDPEEWHGILDRFFAILTDGVHRFEGTINQYLGDGIMALFGAPIAHEDHPQRACYAALHLRDELRRYANELRLERGIAFSTRMGLNSGEVIVGKIGDDLRMDYTAQGHVVNLAQRMEQIAEPGRIYLTEHTAERVRGYFQTSEIGPTRVKGLRAPLVVYELDGVGEFQSRFDVSRARGLSGFVGRDREMAVLEAALARAQGGSQVIVGIVAAAGTGKSRLSYEFAERCRSRGIELATATCPPHGRTIPLGLFMGMQRSINGITERDGAEAARNKIAARLSRMDPQLVEFIPFVMEFLGVSEPGKEAKFADPEARLHELMRYLKTLTDTRGNPLVRVAEDLHWIDPASEAVQLETFRLVRDKANLTIMNFRPEYRPPVADWPSYEEIRLGPLTAESTAELLADLLGPDASHRGLEARIQECAAGNPFFVEEIVQSLQESGHLEGTRGAYRIAGPIDTIHVPDSVQAVLAARIDRLSEDAKQLLCSAAVIGAEFPLALLETVVSVPERELLDLLQQLTSSDFVYQQAAYPELEYAFKHPLTQQVAYDTQLREQRRRVHGEVARALEGRHTEALDEKAALIAHHWERAGESLAAARWTCRAAEQIAWTDATEEQNHWRHLRELATAAGGDAEAHSLLLKACLGILRTGLETGVPEEEATSVYEEGRRLADAAGDRHAAVGLTICFAENTAGVRDHHRGLEEIEEQFRIAEESGDPALLLLIGQGANVTFGVSTERALRLAERAIAAAGELGELSAGSADHVSLARVQRLRGIVLMVQGHYDRAQEQLDSVFALAERSGYGDLAARSMFNMAQVSCRRGEPDIALDRARRALELAEQFGSTNALTGALFSTGVALSLKGDWGGARDALERVLDISSRHNVALGRSGSAYAPLAQVYLELGDRARADELMAEALDLVRDDGYYARRGQSIPTLLLQSRLLAADGNLDESEKRIEQAAERIESTGWTDSRPALHKARANLAALRGDPSGHERELREAHRLYTEMGATGHAEHMTRELAALSR